VAPTIGTSQHCCISVSVSLGVTSCKSTGAFCASICASMSDKQKTHTPPISECVFNGIWSATDGLCVLVFDGDSE